MKRRKKNADARQPQDRQQPAQKRQKTQAHQESRGTEPDVAASTADVSSPGGNNLPPPPSYRQVLGEPPPGTRRPLSIEGGREGSSLLITESNVNCDLEHNALAKLSPDDKEEAETFRKAVNDAMESVSRTMSQSECPKRVKVLCIYWEHTDLGAVTRDDATQLAEIFRNKFNFEAEAWAIPQTFPKYALNSKLLDFAAPSDESKSTLFILHYGGHGGWDSEARELRIMNLEKHTRADYKSMNWKTDVQALLVSDERAGNVLFFVDCCYATTVGSLIQGQQHEKFRVEVLAACDKEYTISVARPSFTGRLKNLLQFYDGHAPLFIRQLCEQLINKKNTDEPTPAWVHNWSGNEIHLCRIGQPHTSSAVEQIDENYYAKFCVHFKELPTSRAVKGVCNFLVNASKPEIIGRMRIQTVDRCRSSLAIGYMPLQVYLPMRPVPGMSLLSIIERPEDDSVPPKYQAPQRSSISHLQDQGGLSYLWNYDTVILIDDSSSMSLNVLEPYDGHTSVENPSRWGVVRELLHRIVPYATQYDEDGIDVYFVESKATHTCIKDPESITRMLDGINVKISDERTGTYLEPRLQQIIGKYLQRLEEQQHVVDPEVLKRLNVIVLTDAEVHDEENLEDMIVRTAERLKKLNAAESQVGIMFAQIGNYETGAKFLNHLDNDIQRTHQLDRDFIDTVVITPDLLKGNENFLHEKILLGGIWRKFDKEDVPTTAKSGNQKDDPTEEDADKNSTEDNPENLYPPGGPNPESMNYHLPPHHRVDDSDIW